jgi:quercetin dioxygenase-like cupin family protein
MFYSFGSTTPQQLFEGFSARIQHGEQITFALVEVDANAALPAHSHHHEQIGVVIRGEMTLTLSGERRVVRTGEGWVIPSLAVHDGVAGPNGAVIVECWSPPREDFRGLVHLAQRPVALLDQTMTQ